MEVVNFQCWQCEEEFSFSVDLETTPQLLLSCPYCGADCFIDFEPYRKASLTVTRGSSDNTGATAFELPKVIGLRKPEGKA